jgi:deoxyribose-phosphate aldolase
VSAVEEHSVSDVDALVEAVTREVLATLAGEAWHRCLMCFGDCVAHNAEDVRSVVAAGASRISFNGKGADVPTDLAGFIDHTLLKPDATASDIDRMCREAVEYRFASVCVNPFWVGRVAELLRGSGVATCSVVGFPLGATPPHIKAMEARRALREGAAEIDMVINVGALKSADHDTVLTDIAGVADACRERGAVCKVILETALLTDEEKVVASRLAKEGKAGYVKTSTGFSSGGATVYDVALMREAVGPGMGVKASGGIRTREEAEAMIAAGATRIGASAGIAIVMGGESSEQY